MVHVALERVGKIILRYGLFAVIADLGGAIRRQQFRLGVGPALEQRFEQQWIGDARHTFDGSGRIANGGFWLLQFEAKQVDATADDRSRQGYLAVVSRGIDLLSLKLE